MRLLRSIWTYRGFVVANVKRDFYLRYQRPILGFAWVLLNPIAMITIYMVVFNRIMSDRLPGNVTTSSYGIYLCCGILAWSLFQDIIQRSQSTFLDHANLLKNIRFPHVLLPLIAVLTALAHSIPTFVVFVVVLGLSGSFPGLCVVAALPVTFVLVGFATGIGVVMGIFNVLIRDIALATTGVLQVWFWLTPIVYPSSVLPPIAADLLRVNPLTPLIEAFHTIFVHHDWPHWVTLIYPTTLALLLCLTGIYAFRRNIADLIDEL